MKGYIHSIESMGLLDGPGIRTVVFFSGCPLRCSYCHNPDTWKCDIKKSVESEDLIKKILRYKPYYEKSSGGVTFSGGECLMQPEFLNECLKLCRANGIHTAIDTSGHGFSNYDEILENTDLVILDVKHIDEYEYLKLTGRPINEMYNFLNACINHNKKLWIREVLIPNYNDTFSHIEKLANFLKGIPNIEKVELLPYHVLGVHKYESLKIPYKLKDVPPLSNEKHKELSSYFNKKFCEEKILVTI